MTATSDAMAERLIRQCEGCKLAPYQDTAGVWTIGIGSTMIAGRRVTAATPPITQAVADALLLADMHGRCAAIDAMVTVPVADHERAALISFAYNLGVGALRGSMLLRKLNAGDRQGAADQFPAWCHAGGRVVAGLQTRRALERAVFLGETVI